MKVPAFCFKLIMVEYIGKYHEQIQDGKDMRVMKFYKIAAE